MSVRSFAVFFILVGVLAIPSTYQVPCPIEQSVIEVPVSGMASVKLDAFNASVVNVVRLGCGLYAVYTVKVTLAFSNTAEAPVNASVMVYSRDSVTGTLYYQYPLTHEIPPQSKGFVVVDQVPAKLYVGAGGLPVLAFSAQLFEASGVSSVTVAVPSSACGGKETVSLLKWIFLEMTSGNRTKEQRSG